MITSTIIFILGIFLVSCQNIQLVNNGYENILISISEDVKYDPSLIPYMKDTFNKASAVLFKATNNRAYFRKITILIPSKWNVPEAEEATTELATEANIRVETDTAGPLVRGYSKCGGQGEFMHLYFGFFSSKENGYAPQEKTIIHEWGHLRWGVKDEYAYPTEPQFYISSAEEIEAVRCNTNIKGTRGVPGANGYASCKIDSKTSLPEKGCRFYPESSGTTAVASLMYYQYLNSVVSFCDSDDQNPNSVHNYEATNRHNTICRGKSIWDVMKESSDFKNGNNPSIPTANTDVTFKIVQRQQEKVVVVMDVSGSMLTNRYFEKLNAAVRQYLLFTVPNGASVGLVKYSTYATSLTWQLRKIHNETDRNALAQLVPLQYSGGTSIGAGLYRAHQMLSTNGADATGSIIIVVTDGEENNSPYVAEVLPAIKNAGIVVYSIMLSSSASVSLSSAAETTGGRSYFASGDDQSTALNDAFTTVQRIRTSDPTAVPIMIESRIIAVSAQNQTCHDVTIDSALGRGTTFIFSWTDSNVLQFSIGVENETINVVLGADSRTAVGKCPKECATGIWTVCIANNADWDANIVARVESHGRGAGTNSTGERIVPITVDTYILNKEPDFDKIGGDPVIVVAFVSRGYAPVVGAEVVATVESPDSANKTIVVMRDDGAGSDGDKDDGSYSAYILNSESTGRHTISVQVTSTERSSIKIEERDARGSIPADGFSSLEPSLIPTDQFERFSLSGYINVLTVAPFDQDMYPPARIIDLEMTKAKYEDDSITLEWTAVGDDLDSGRASRYELWRADDYKVLYEAQKENATLINGTDIISGTLDSPLPPYSREKLTIAVTDKDKVYIYAIIAKDDQGNTGEMSNLVAVKLIYVPESPEEPSKNGNGITAIVIGVVVGLIALSVLVVVTVWLVRRKRQGDTTSGTGAAEHHSNRAFQA